VIYYGVATAESQSIRKEAGIEGSLEFGQKNISTLKRNLLNADEILRIPYNQLLVNIRGNKPLLLEKMIYTEHELANKLKDVSVNEYKPIWNKKEILKPVIKETSKNEPTEEKNNNDDSYEEITFENF
jgi:type IV secretion system protein VirD4